tara:strand:+ start:2181 stop:2381 length:201 start_codon:yes stop_codon:yes gene_type:complete
VDAAIGDFARDDSIFGGSLIILHIFLLQIAELNIGLVPKVAPYSDSGRLSLKRGFDLDDEVKLTQG